MFFMMSLTIVLVMFFTITFDNIFDIFFNISDIMYLKKKSLVVYFGCFKRNEFKDHPYILLNKLE